MTHLKNGARMIGLLENEHGEVFVAARCDDAAQEYATWQLNPEDDTTFWGHYFSSRKDAFADLIERAGLAGRSDD